MPAKHMHACVPEDDIHCNPPSNTYFRKAMMDQVRDVAQSTTAFQGLTVPVNMLRWGSGGGLQLLPQLQWVDM